MLLKHSMSDGIPFVRDLRFAYGVLEQVAPNVRRLIARNPGPFTHYGSGTYVLGRGRVAIVDPGPLLSEHVEALLAELADEEITHILVTHTHVDHSPAARLLQERCAAPTYGFGPHLAGRHQVGEDVEAGADLDFTPDIVVHDADVIEATDFTVEAVHTPGHCRNHLCFQLREEHALFTGDHVMAWATSVIAPPDGDMGDYLRSLSRLLPRNDALYLPTHGAPINDPRRFVHAYLRHRQLREQQITQCLTNGIGLIADIVPLLYAGVPQLLHPAAARSVFAHLLHLLERDLVQAEGAPSLEAHYHLR